MGSFRFAVPTRAATLSAVFSSMPAEVKGFLREGFATLAKIPPERFQDLLKAVLEQVQEGYAGGGSEFAKTLGIPPEEGGPLFAAAGLFTSIFSSREVVVDDLMRYARTAEVINEKNAQAALQFAQLAARDRAAIARAMEQSGIASAVLPSLSTFETTVDLRLGFEKGRISTTVPLAVLHVDTDAEGQEVWVQLTKREVQRIVEDLQGVIRRLEEAEKWMQQVDEGGRK